MEFERHELVKLFAEAVELGIKWSKIDDGKEPAYLNRSQAWLTYGKANVEGWIRKGLITPKKDGDKNSMVRLDKIELAILAKSSNRNTHTPKTRKNEKQR
jgi:hypothetical protein